MKQKDTGTHIVATLSDIYAKAKSNVINVLQGILRGIIETVKIGIFFVVLTYGFIVFLGALRVVFIDMLSSYQSMFQVFTFLIALASLYIVFVSFMFEYYKREVRVQLIRSITSIVRTLSIIVAASIVATIPFSYYEQAGINHEVYVNIQGGAYVILIFAAFYLVGKLVEVWRLVSAENLIISSDDALKKKKEKKEKKRTT